MSWDNKLAQGNSSLNALGEVHENNGYLTHLQESGQCKTEDASQFFFSVCKKKITKAVEAEKTL